MSDKKRVFETYQHWTTQFCQNNSIYRHLIELFGFDQWQGYPGTEQLNALLQPDTITHSGFKVNFVDQDNIEFNDRAYETVIYETGQIPTRADNWHDMFGAFIWCLLPKTKALLNYLHHQDIIAHGQKVRTKTRNAITLLDECGVIVAVNDEHFKSQMRNHQWHWCFVEQRRRWGRDVFPFTIGHANYEMLTKPYIGLTGKVLFVTVNDDFAKLSLAEQYRVVDELLAKRIADDNILKDNSELSPLPLLGVPGWYQGNETAAFYDNKSYFREKTVK